MRYIYRGDRWTDPALKGLRCDPVRTCQECEGRGGWLDAPQNVLDGRSYWETCPACGGTGGKCVRGKNGNMLVVDAAGTRHVVLGRQLRIQR